MRRRFVCGNWKMNGTEDEAVALVGSLLRLLPAAPSGPEVALAPPFTSLRTVGERLRGSGFSLAAQNLHQSSHGAFTGEVSSGMLTALGVRFVIVGHSERRRLLGESDEVVGRKAAAATQAGLVPILCIGEEETQRMEGRTLEVIEAQLAAALAGLGTIDPATLIVAYEPVWAIGTGRTASPEQVVEAHGAIRAVFRRRAGEKAAAEIRVLYGGSVTGPSAPAIFRSPEVDGALVGGASLVAESFAAIVSAASRPPLEAS